MAPHVLPYIQSPLFQLNSHYDSWQSGCVMTAEFVYSNSSTQNGASLVIRIGFEPLCIFVYVRTP